MSDLLEEIERNVAEGKTSWIYTLNKAALQRVCEHYKISITEETTVDELRKLLAEFTKEQNPSDATSKQSRGEKGPTHDTTGSVNSESVSTQARIIFAMPAIGKLTEFAQDQQSWEDYIEQIEFYLDANNIIEESKKRSTLLTAVGTSNYATIKSLCSPEAPKNVSYENILKKCQQHFGKRINELLGRVKFHKRDQGNNETLQEFVSEIRKLALDCKFTGPDGKLPLETMLRDRFVAGIANEELQRYLCRRHEEYVSDTNTVGLTLDKALEIAGNAEAAEQQQKIIRDSEAWTIKKITQNKGLNKNKPNNRDEESTRKPCFRCGYTNHTADKCFYKNETCNFCEKTGHISRACITKKNAKPQTSGKKKETPKTQQINQDSDSESDISSDDLYASPVIQSTSNKEKVDDYIVEVEVESKPVKFEVDNGAHLSLINKKTYKKLWPDKEPCWSEKKPKLFGYGKKPLKVLGTTDVFVKYKKVKTTLPLVIVDESGQNLLGRNWFKTLGIRVTGINNISRKEPGLRKKSVLKQFTTLTLPTLSGHNGPPINIQLRENARPRFIKARRIPFGLQEAASDALKTMVQQGMLRPVDQSDWATPVLFVRKPNGKIRVVGDYKITVNPEIMKSEYPLPTVAEALATLNGGVIFSQVDLKDAYKQLRVDEETSKILTISTPMGLFNVMRLLDGIAAAPCIFQKYMVTIMSGIPGIQIYLDNIKIQGKTSKEHDERLIEVLHRLQRANLRINVEKSIFRVKSMEFLGHKISEEGIQTLDDKVKAIKEIPAPKNKRDLQVFLGGVNFYARFIKDRARIAEPLHRLLDNSTEWKWTDKEQKSFDRLKTELTGSEVLMHFNDVMPIVLSADASPHGIGAVLAHELPDGRERAIAFSSKSLSKTQRRYAQLDREALALVGAVKHFHQYIAGRGFKLITDHKPLLGIFDHKKKNQDLISPKLNRYKITLAAYDYELMYRPAKKHGNADLLSRFPLEEEATEDEKIGDVLMLEGVTKNPITPEEIAEETEKDKDLRLIKKWLQTQWPSKIPPELKVFWQKRDEMSIIDECIIRGARVVVPRALQPEILNYLHANHTGIVTTKACARSYVWWPGINNEIELKIKNCDKCQEVQNNPPRAPVQAWETPGKPWKRLHIDFAGPFQGQIFLIIVDAYSKWTEVRRVPSTASANVIREFRKIFATFGLPEMIVSDNDTAFRSSEMEKFYRRNGIEFVFIAPYHPSSNGQAERAVQTTKKSLKTLQEGDWEMKISRFLLKQHSTPTAATGVTPAELILQRKLRTPLDVILPKDKIKSKEEKNKKTPEGTRELKINDQVQMRTHRPKGSKWTRGMITEKTGPLSYIVREEDTGSLHKRHIDHLRKIPKLTIGNNMGKKENDCEEEKIDQSSTRHGYNLRKTTGKSTLRPILG